MFGLEGKVAVVTGGAGGIGTAICRRLIQAGSIVAIVDLDKEKAIKVASELNSEEEKGQATGYGADITDLSGLMDSVKLIKSELGKISILINNAGWEEYRRFIDTDQAYRKKNVNINLMGTFNVLEAFLPAIIETGGGSIVNIASEAGRIGSPGESVYSACKAGLMGLSKSLAREHGKNGITVNAICPGPIDTPLLDKFIGGARSPERFREGLRSNIPLGRIGKPQDIAGLAAFLSSDEASYITGEIISVSGGLSMAG